MKFKPLAPGQLKDTPTANLILMFTSQDFLDGVFIKTYQLAGATNEQIIEQFTTDQHQQDWHTLRKAARDELNLRMPTR